MCHVCPKARLEDFSLPSDATMKIKSGLCRTPAGIVFQVQGRLVLVILQLKKQLSLNTPRNGGALQAVLLEEARLMLLTEEKQFPNFPQLELGQKNCIHNIVYQPGVPPLRDDNKHFFLGAQGLPQMLLTKNVSDLCIHVCCQSGMNGASSTWCQFIMEGPWPWSQEP